MANFYGVYKSRFTPGLKNGADVNFNKNEVVIYSWGQNRAVVAIISSLRKHKEAPGDQTGYDVIFNDTGRRSFVARCDIIDWDGRKE